uniref:colicin E3-like toxin immunity protein n=1 Tax=Yersinia frederiksenii TaxID=29484 RepID=UPI001F4C2C25|nr:colicin E3-like toxin immunity protein [Yersinia frederiksenii]ULG19872.1 cloacin [Yersinia frederiksenii]
MGLKLRVNWYDKKTELLVGQEYSQDFGNDDFLIEETVNPKDENIINNGEFDLEYGWVIPIQKHIVHKIEMNTYDYQIAFEYSDTW